MATRQKKALIQETPTQDEALKCFAEYTSREAQIRKLTAEMDVKLTKIREQYADRIAEHTAVRDDNFELLQTYAVGNPELFTKRKSIETAFGVLGFRTGTPKLKLLKGFQWGAVLQLIKDRLPDYVRSKEEVDKEGLLANRDMDHVAKNLRPCGIEVIQDETFYVEPKLEEVTAAA